MNPLILILIAAGFLMLNKSSSASSTAATSATIDQMRTALINWVMSSSSEQDKSVAVVFQSMNSGEITDCYNYVFNYVNKGLRPAAGSTLYNSIQAISAKYNIFT